MEEHNRLLYVALTRAEDRLVVCGWQTRRGGAGRRAGTAWSRAASPALDAEPEPFGRDWGERLLPRERRRRARRSAAAMPPASAARRRCPPGPARARTGGPRRRRPSRRRPVPLAPSRPDGRGCSARCRDAASPLAQRAAPAARFQRGQLIHALLQHCPRCRRRSGAAAARAGSTGPGMVSRRTMPRRSRGEVLAVLRHPELAPLFGPASRAEVPLTGLVGGAVVGGLVDRLAVLPDRVLVADYKTSRDAARRRGGDAGAVSAPDGGLSRRAARRLPGPAGALRAGLDRRPRVVALPDALLDRTRRARPTALHCSLDPAPPRPHFRGNIRTRSPHERRTPSAVTDTASRPTC